MAGSAANQKWARGANEKQDRRLASRARGTSTPVRELSNCPSLDASKAPAQVLLNKFEPGRRRTKAMFGQEFCKQIDGFFLCRAKIEPNLPG